jgi:hypothetical protein
VLGTVTGFAGEADDGGATTLGTSFAVGVSSLCSLPQPHTSSPLLATLNANPNLERQIDLFTVPPEVLFSRRPLRRRRSKQPVQRICGGYARIVNNCAGRLGTGEALC